MLNTAKTKTPANNVHSTNVGGNAGSFIIQLEEGENASSNNKGQTSSFFSGVSKPPPFFSNTFIQPKLTIGESNGKYEQEADAMADQVVQKLSVPEIIQTKYTACAHQENTIARDVVQQSPIQNFTGISTDNSIVIQKGEAGVHHGIEQEAAGVEEGLSDPQAVEEMYAGNWMRDFSQLNVPVVHNALAAIPRRIDGSAGLDGVGHEGATDIANGLLRALAMLEFGPEITNSLITEENIGVYTPEQHIDNPQGTRVEDHLVVDEDGNHMPAGDLGEDTSRESPRESGGWHSVHPEINEQLGGSAVPGPQMENQLLYQVSSSGMGMHIYNSVEWTKDKLLRALRAGPSPTGRMHLGTGLHAVEDYFSHSNFIEVALNSEITRATMAQDSGDAPTLPTTFLRIIETEGSAQAGNFVDTLYDARTEDNRNAITTGTFGTMDTAVSLAHAVLPKLPTLAAALNAKIDEMLNWPPSGDPPSFSEFEAAQDGNRKGLAFLEIVNAFDRHVEAPVYSMEFTYGQIPFTDLEYPNGVEFTKEYKGIKQAYNHYAGLYKEINDAIDRIEALKNRIEVMLIFPLIVRALTSLIRTLRERIRQYIAEFKRMIKQKINEIMFSLIERIIGRDIPEEKKRTIGDAVDFAHFAVEEMEHRTSLESRIRGENNELKRMRDKLAREGFSPEEIQQEIQNTYGLDANDKEIVPLPPSHSEISKDHPPHQEHAESHNFRLETRRISIMGREFEVQILVPHTDEEAAEDPEHELADGSPFYGIHRELALEADRHIIAQVHDIWEADFPTPNETRGDVVNARTIFDRDELMDQAIEQQAIEEERARREGRSFRTGQEDTDVSEAQEVLALVDLFISHPDDNNWWRPIIQNYVARNEAEVIAHIRARNQTRSNRR